jgi:hypothetical protein
MTLGQPTRHGSGRQHSCWCVTRNPGTRHIFVDSHSLELLLVACITQIDNSLLRAHQILQAKRLTLFRHAELLHSRVAAKSP